MHAGQSSTMAMWVPEGFFLTLLPYSVLGALSNCEQGLYYPTHFKNGPLEPGYIHSTSIMQMRGHIKQ